jgi:uncharacterized tellurite resistance protein B-like protein
VYRAGDARFRRLLMNKLQLTKGELTKIILEEVRNLQEQIDPSKQAEEAKAEIADFLSRASDDQVLAAANMLKEMDNYE